IELPHSYKLLQNYPNPFKYSTDIRYAIDQGKNVRIRIRDLLGNHVNTLLDSFHQAGSYTYTFNAGKLASGTYIVEMITDNSVLRNKIVIIQ
ncbi:MAG: T9SS type A sorting domain-containing protein, partial [Bacteroidetes bacterium]|nr:T9SS type A sorting domain-containing protein [Bacteroidota bacterium]